jgi:hypothetical protein
VDAICLFGDQYTSGAAIRKDFLKPGATGAVLWSLGEAGYAFT